MTSRLVRHPWTWRLLALAIVAGIAAVAVAQRFGPETADAPAPREITIVARGMAFYVDGDSAPNPVIRVRAGETVRVVLRNDDPGLVHDFVVKDWGVATRLLQARASDAVTVTAPARPGQYAYLCTPHPSMMRGAIDVQ